MLGIRMCFNGKEVFRHVTNCYNTLEVKGKKGKHDKHHPLLQGCFLGAYILHDKSTMFAAVCL